MCSKTPQRERGRERERERKRERETERGGEVLNQKEVIRRDLMMMMVMRASESTD